MIRQDGRNLTAVRNIKITKAFMRNAHGSALIEWGGTRVLCSAMYSAGVPSFLEGTDKGWLTAEYSMLPASTHSRKPRELRFPDGRSTEISRLIGRSLRSVFDMHAAAGYTINIDCDVIDADGGTRTASITGAYVALVLCVRGMISEGILNKDPVRDGVAAVSCGIVAGEPMLDLVYSEDSRADADMNIVMSHSGGIVEIQCTGEKRPVRKTEFIKLLKMAEEGITYIRGIQTGALSE